MSLSKFRWILRSQYGIYARALTAISVVLIAVTLLTTIWSVQKQQRYLTDQLMTRLDNLAGWQAVSVSNSLWDLNRDSVRASLRGLALDPEFVSAVVRDEKGRIFAQVGSGDVERQPVISTRKEIFIDTQGRRENIGTLSLTLSLKALLEEQNRSLVELLTLALIQLATVLIVVALVLRTLIRPLAAVTDRMVGVAQGNLDSAVPHQHRTDPVGDVARAVESFRSIALLRTQEQQALRQAHDQLYKINADLAAAGRAKDEFLASISHELRTPLSTIMWIAELLIDNIGGTLDDKQRHHVQMIYDNSQHLLTLINDLLDIARANAGELQLNIETINVKETCLACIQLIKPEADRKQQQLSVDIGNDNGLITVRADPRRLKQILVNLLSNAVKFTPRGGQIGLQVASDDEHGSVQFHVRDTGIGIADDAMTQLFKPFVQIDSRLSREYEGSGLGLSLVHHLVGLHGGSIAVQSTVGKGSCFTVTLGQALWPVAAAAAAVTKAVLPSNTPTPIMHLLHGHKHPAPGRGNGEPHARICRTPMDRTQFFHG